MMICRYSNFFRYSLWIFAFTALLPVHAEVAREWVSNDGKKLQATLVRTGEGNVLLRLENNREVSVPLERLSGKDRKFISDYESGLVARVGEIAPLPDETRPPDDIEVTGGPKTFYTPHFEFTSGREVSKNFIAEAAKIYEGTYEAVKAIPHGLPLTPPEGSSHFRGEFMDDSDFQKVVQSSNIATPTTSQPYSRTRVAGLYRPKEQSLLVPYISLGAKRNGSRITLRKSSDTSTLVHEISHQVMHDWLPFVPTWFAEGMAEYISAVPSQTGRFEFKNAERGLRERLKDKYGLKSYDVYFSQRPSKRLGIDGGDSEGSESAESGRNVISFGGDKKSTEPGGGWSGSMEDYRDAMLLVYFLMHLDDPSSPGTRVGTYLQAVERGRASSGKIQADIALFEENRKKYNEEVESFNTSLLAFKNEVEAYNARVTAHNKQLADGVPEEERVKVGDIPEEPTPPGELVMPESVKAASGGVAGPINLTKLVWRQSAGELAGNRSGAELDAAVVKAFGEIGITITYPNR